MYTTIVEAKGTLMQIWQSKIGNISYEAEPINTQIAGFRTV